MLSLLFKRDSRAFRIVLIALLTLALSAVSLASAQSSTSMGVVSSADGQLSLHLPTGWLTQEAPVAIYSTTLVFGDTASSLQGVVDLLTATTLVAVPGISGVIAIVGSQYTAGLDASTGTKLLFTSVINEIKQSGGDIVEQDQITSPYTGWVAVAEDIQIDTKGIVGVMASGTNFIVFQIETSPASLFDSSSDVLTEVVDSIRVPAEAGSSVPVQQPTAEQQPTAVPNPTETEAVPSNEIQTYRSGDARVSLDLPGDWAVIDRVADGDILAYGDTTDAAMSRLYSVKPELATKTVISGNGGVVVLYPMSLFGIDPHNPDLMPLMERALGNLSGYTVVKSPEPLEGIDGAVIAVIGGTEHGYLALIPFGDQLAYVTATVSSGSFDDQSAALLDIVKSVHIPAIPESSGLGGLGGLEVTQEATPVVTPEATLSGLGGLGGLEIVPPATSEATEMVTPESTAMPPVVATPEATPDLNG